MTSSHALLTLLMCALGSSLMTLENARGARDCDAVHAEGHAETYAPTTLFLASHGCGRFANRLRGGADGFCATELERPWPASRSARRLALERLRQPARSVTPERGRLAGALVAAAFSAPTADWRGSLWIAAQSAAPQAWRQLEALGWTERPLAAGRIWAANSRRLAFRSPGPSSAAWRLFAARVLRPTWLVFTRSALDFGVAVRSGLDLAEAKSARTLALVRCREWLAADKLANANARPLTHWRAKRPRVVGARPGDAGLALTAAAFCLQTMAAESLAGAGNAMLDLSRTIRETQRRDFEVSRENLGAQARKGGFLEL